ncbi:MAG TPA: SDR family oxidoreductase [Thermoflexales bacterium]|nr:SDR family oxidoreductase [Thermoflexales bacterium]HQW36293.1 SDR family oxidoreductase [Thermoflexales bacterium]HQX76672.1 SDR family oxidoreductase [Thermoflexales bacterium]HQZ22871.1 SDR family oxidoreductase [Thermoflexales bacterium]HRA00296.1 SDR family oxidoreductase [Thermoflexales bacterium]
MRLQGKVAVITGAASGMGLAMAKIFTAQGASVVAADWNGQRLNEVVASIKAGGGAITGVQGNIADQATAEGLIDAAVATYGKLDILCNNAGIMDYMQGVGELDNEIWRKVLGVNLDGPMFTTRKAIQIMKGKGGSIINTASTAGLQGGAAGAAYTVSKHGLVGLTRNTAWMYAKQGIRCNAICPGATKTNIGETMPRDRINPVGAARAGEYAALVPAYLDPEDIANLALFLASDESVHINGAIIPADGGWTA